MMLLRSRVTVPRVGGMSNRELLDPLMQTMPSSALLRRLALSTVMVMPLMVSPLQRLPHGACVIVRVQSASTLLLTRPLPHARTRRRQPLPSLPRLHK